MQLCSVRGKALVFSSSVGSMGITRAAFSPTGRYLAAIGSTQLLVISTISGAVVGSRALQETDQDFELLAWHPDARGLSACAATFRLMRPWPEPPEVTTTHLLQVSF